MTRFGELWELSQQLRTADEKNWHSLLELLDLPPCPPARAHISPQSSRCGANARWLFAGCPGTANNPDHRQGPNTHAIDSHSAEKKCRWACRARERCACHH
ncbi:hypothetical protein CTRI78_v010040 [Colletotrichum trifolii]|uniref:Uncharacterized protein n=1 Tax=Colletotrichum trifolii TaxID=5466 RepID=A0A4R8QVC5_COLTR|nr:hypothetical protein CTRI78_v010040 [Colletotrichum trifolii]